MPRPLALEPYFRSIRQLPGVGPRLQPLLLKLLGGECLIDLLLHAPNDVIDRRLSPPLKETVSGQVVTLKAEVKTVQFAPRGKPTKIICQTPEGFFELVYFNAAKKFIEDEFPRDRRIAVSGKIERYNDKIQMVHPDMVVDEDQFGLIAILEPVYPLTQGVTNRRLHNLIQTALGATPEIGDWLDETIAKRENWDNWRATLTHLHSGNFAANAIERLAYDEALAQQLTLALQREKGRSKKGFSYKPATALREKIIKQLPYQLTDAQKRSLAEIDSDMMSESRMLRLMQGDVGSGKTIVAFLAMLNVIAAGKQALIMAPTEILAMQHWASIKELAESLSLKTALYTGRQKDEVMDADIIIGTHALFQEGALFRDIGLAVIDEQHRFGVEQRLKLSAKGLRPDILAMTATPIPRSLTLAAYGDMDVSRIDEKPPTRKPVDTRLIHAGHIDDLVRGLANKIENGERVFWVCPLIEESEKIDLAAAQDRYDHLLQIFGDKVGLLHGRLKGPEKDRIMNDFVEGRLSILVSTTVIEVGVNVPEATVMVVEQAERFGLAQLHQLRGRVGRGDLPATCILMYRTPISQNGRERLQIMRDTEDGFVIAEKDLELRGGGEVLGTRQSGLPEFKFLDLEKHQRLMLMAQQEARMIVEKDPDLKSSRGEALRNLLYLHKSDDALRLLGAG